MVPDRHSRVGEIMEFKLVGGGGGAHRMELEMGNVFLMGTAEIMIDFISKKKPKRVFYRL